MLPIPIRRPAAACATSYKQAEQDLSQSSDLQPSSGNNGTAMPFLSPTIPTKTPRDLYSVEPLSLAQSAEAEYFGSFSTASLHDSDSDDDDNFEPDRGRKHALRSPQRLINVPLPRTSGAVFGPSGVLAIFRPPQAKPSVSSKEDELRKEPEAAQLDQQRSMIALFPTFGNLSSTSEHSAIRNSGVDIISILGLDQTSYTSDQSWKPQSLSISRVTKVAIMPMVKIDVVDCAMECKTAHSRLAKAYRVVTKSAESGSDMCLANASVAAEAGHAHSVLIWQMLAKIIEDNVGRAAQLWADHPLGSSWLIRRMYALAEAHASLQMLANITAVLVGSASTSKLISMGSLVDRLAVISRPKIDPPTTKPRLVTEFPDHKSSSKRSPIKILSTSAVSSRGHSQPTTPRLESMSSTPPWPFVALTQGGTKASLANSISPETSRGSFSAAVKSYAQSVSDKFALYGTSPPVRRSAVSGPLELSSSLQSAGGSWMGTKSVSFASTRTPQRASNLSRRTTDADGGYDSDLTIEDALIIDDGPMEPESGARLTWKHQSAFCDPPSGSAQTMLIPQDLLPQCSIWVAEYVKQLRSWQLDKQAVEMSKVGRVLHELVGHDAEEWPNVLLALPSSTTIMCGICTCIVEGLQQSCPDCGHSYHITCLHDLVSMSVHDFECPDECGCNCVLNVPD